MCRWTSSARLGRVRRPSRPHCAGKSPAAPRPCRRSPELGPVVRRRAELDVTGHRRRAGGHHRRRRSRLAENVPVSRPTAPPDRTNLAGRAEPLLGALCPAEHWPDALNVLDQVGTMGIAPGEPAPLVDAAASTKPAASIHAAAALVAWFVRQPAAWWPTGPPPCARLAEKAMAPR